MLDHYIAYILPNRAMAQLTHLCDHNGRTACGVKTGNPDRWWIWHQSEGLGDSIRYSDIRPRVCPKCRKAEGGG